MTRRWLLLSLALIGCIRSTIDPDAVRQRVDELNQGAVQVSNVRANGIIQSGFLVGTATAGADSVRVSFDGAGSFAATFTGGGYWKAALPLPASGIVWQENSLHTALVTATASGNLVGALTIQFRKGPNHDISGDGYEDLVVGGSSASGKVYVFYSQGTTGIPSANDTGAQRILNGSSMDNLGSAVAMGDVNGDGYADLAIGAVGVSSNHGACYLYLSQGTGGIGTSAQTVLTGPLSVANFGSAVLLGDITGDGYADLVAGAYSMSSNLGAAYVFHSQGSNGIASGAYSTANTTLTGSASGGFFGNSAALGDANGDGYIDVVVGAYGAASSQGRAYIFHSRGPAGIASQNDTSASAILSGIAAGESFAYALAFGDANGDGYADLAAGAYSAGTGGKAYVFYAQGGAGIGNAASANATFTGMTASGQFGVALAFGDVDGDGFADLAVGAANAASNMGATFVFHAQGSSGFASLNDSAANAQLTGTITSGYFGSRLRLGDVDGDGFSDLAVGAFGANSSQGKAYIFRSRGASGIQSVSDTAATSVFTGTSGITSFGVAIAN